MTENISQFKAALNQFKSELEERFDFLLKTIEKEQAVDRKISNFASESSQNEQSTTRQVSNLNSKLQDMLSLNSNILREIKEVNISFRDIAESVNNAGGSGGGLLGGGILGGVAGGLIGSGIMNSGAGISGSGGLYQPSTSGGGGNFQPSSAPNVGVQTRQIENLDYSSLSDIEGLFSGNVSEAASIRYNNPGAMYPAGWQSEFGGTDPQTRIGGGHRIAMYPDMQSGAAALFALLNRGLYRESSVSEAIDTWSGGNNVSSYLDMLAQFGIGSDEIISDILADPERAVILAAAMSRHETGHPYPLSADEWMGAYASSGVPEEYGIETTPLEPIPSESRNTDISQILGSEDERVAVGKIPTREEYNSSGVFGARLYHPEYNSWHGGATGRDWADYSQFLYPVWESEELPEGLSLGLNTRTITDPISGEEREVSFNVIRENGFYTTSGPVVDNENSSPVRISVNSGLNIADQLEGGTLPSQNQAAAIYQNADIQETRIEGNTLGADPTGAESILSQGGMEEIRAYDEFLMGEGGLFQGLETNIESQEFGPRITQEETQELSLSDYFEPLQYSGITPETDIFTMTADLSGIVLSDALENADMLSPEEETLVSDLSDPFSDLNQSPSRATDMLLAGLESEGITPPEETPSASQPQRRGGGGPAPQSEQLNANVIGRFNWGERIIRYYSLQSSIRTNMLQ